MGSGERVRLLNNALGSATVLSFLAAVAFGLPAWDRSLPSGRRLPDGRPYRVGAGVSLVPPPGALLDVTRTRPTPSRGTALFLLGTIRYAVVAEPFVGSLDQAVQRLRTKITSNRGYQVTGGDTPVRTADGAAGRQGSYTTPGRDGWYAVYLANGTSVEVTVTGTEPALRENLAAIDRSVATIHVEGSP